MSVILKLNRNINIRRLTTAFQTHKNATLNLSTRKQYSCNCGLFNSTKCIGIIKFKQLCMASNARYFSQTSTTSSDENQLTALKFEHFCAETLESLYDYFDELVESNSNLASTDVIYKV